MVPAVGVIEPSEIASRAGAGVGVGAGVALGALGDWPPPHAARSIAVVAATTRFARVIGRPPLPRLCGLRLPTPHCPPNTVDAISRVCLANHEAGGA